MADKFDVVSIGSAGGVNGTAKVRYTDSGDGSFAPVSASIMMGTEYETVAAGQTNQALGSIGSKGNLLLGLLIIPTNLNPGAVTIKDGSNSVITVFIGGTGSVSNLVPFYIPLNLKSIQGGWQVSTGSNVSIIAGGDFS